MGRPVLDPGQVTAARRDVFIVLPPTAREFGYVPDVTAMQPGDAVLQAPVVPTMVGKRIRDWQAGGGLTAENSRWTHVAVHVGDGVLVENMPGSGVRIASIYDRVPSHIMMVRRDDTLDRNMMFQIAINALTRLGRDYSKWELPAMAAQAVRGFWKPDGTAQRTKAFVCSTLFSDAYADATGRSVVSERRVEDIWPGHIAATVRLTDVTVPWVEVG